MLSFVSPFELIRVNIFDDSELRSRLRTSEQYFVYCVGIATCYELDGRGVGVQVPEKARFFSSSRP
jgi:hypothetical protein